MPKYNTIVIGAGASGLLAASRVAQRGAKTLLLEKMQKPALKLFITGKGRCNITTAEDTDFFIRQINPNAKFLRNSLFQFFSQDILQILEQQGVSAVLERGNRYFPSSNKASDVVRALVQYTRQSGAEICCNEKVEKLIIENKEIKGIETDKRKIFADNIIIATGGKSYPATGSTGDGYNLAKQAGHTVTNILPSLVPIETKNKIPNKWHKLLLKNVNTKLYIDNKKVNEEFGELQFMEFGLSGATILALSRQAVKALSENKKVKISLDLKPALDNKKLDNRLLREIKNKGKTKVTELIKTLLPKIMVDDFIDIIAISAQKKCSEINGKERNIILSKLKNFEFEITKPRSFNEAIITAGGVNTKEINPKTMESKIMKNLYFAGEILDLDAPTGGYNLQIAFTTGWIAGNSVKLSI